MRIALDAAGGDFGAIPNVAGAVRALQTTPDLTIVLVGDQPQLESLLSGQAGVPSQRLEIVHAPEAVGMKDKPSEALRRKPDASIFRCWQLLAEHRVDGLVSAGNTGAVVAGGLKTRRFLPCVHRPGIAAVMPNARGQSVVIDVGANVFPKPRHLLEYAVMGSVFARELLKIPRPAVGLMNVGEEEGKGHELVQKSYELLRQGPLREQFVGNVEGRDIPRGAADVIVTDGFTGNVVLKLSEGIFEFLMQVVRDRLIEPLQGEKERAAQALHDLIRSYHYSTFGGAPLLGIDGVCLICHGSSTDVAIANALRSAAQLVRLRLNASLVEALEQLPANGEE
ncbi:MAG: phosphate acyltransferase PlsX [Gemmataceae bacterium]|nr:phosphate acyltransferase PlsX [Gemmataceae bacterium]MDW8242412.1 phosphate acyltransferase PlsX [Thermogemmata sp.]